jgi:ABC-type polysaccharide transport system permease subunit
MNQVIKLALLLDNIEKSVTQKLVKTTLYFPCTVLYLKYAYLCI